MKKSINPGGSRPLYSFTIAMLIFFAMSVTCQAQEEEPIYTTIAYMKVKQGDEGNYVDIEKTYWKPIHQELVKQGKILGWYLYRIRYTGTGDEYQYATVTHIRGNENLEAGMYTGDLFSKVHPKVETSEIMAKTTASRDIVTRRLQVWQLSSFPEGDSEPSKYAVVNFQRSVPGTNYFALRRDYVKPAFDLAVKEGKMAGWGLWSLMFPQGGDIDYNWISVDLYNDFSKINQFGWADLITRANPKINLDEIGPQLGESRTMTRNELWVLVDYAR
ncbi:MAG: hypothetical protein ACFHWX_22495 [Bacteroidota bacterium]